MKSKVVIRRYQGLPCALEIFTINGVEATLEDFGQGYDFDEDNAPDYGCGNWQFKRWDRMPDGVLEKYHIEDPQDWWDIGDLLMKELSVGTCSWCA